MILNNTYSGIYCIHVLNFFLHEFIELKMYCVIVKQNCTFVFTVFKPKYDDLCRYLFK